MSTAELYLQPEEIEPFIQDTLSDDALCAIGEEGQSLGIVPYITFYIHHNEQQFMAVAEAVISVYEAFEKLIDEPFELRRDARAGQWFDAGSQHQWEDLRTGVKRCQKEGDMFMLGATDMASLGDSARWAAWATVSEDGLMEYSEFKLTFRNKWFQQNKQRWYDFIQDSLQRLQPEQCYSGFEVGNGGFNIMGSYEADVLERICADHFYGMDIDHPTTMCFHSYRHTDGSLNPSNLGAGLRTPTWCFLLTPIWRKKLGLTEAQVLAELDDPRIDITVLPYAASEHNPEGENALWIRLGELDLHPVERGVPELLAKANALIRPIRCDELRLLTLDPWDDDPNPRFDWESSMRWMRRFDADSDWPSAERRQPAVPAPVEPRLRCMPGEAVPRAGWWWTPAFPGDAGRKHFTAGERFPPLQHTDYGAVVWYFDPQRQGD